MPIIALGDLELHPDDLDESLDKVLEGVKASVDKHYKSDIYRAPLVGPIARKLKDLVFGAPVITYTGDTVSKKTQSAALKVASDIVYKALNDELSDDLSQYVKDAGYKFSDKSLGKDLANVYGDVLFNESLTDEPVGGFYSKVFNKLNQFCKRNKVKLAMTLGNNDPGEKLFKPRYEALVKRDKLKKLVFINDEVKKVNGYRVAAMNGSPEASNTLVGSHIDSFFNGLIDDKKKAKKALEKYKSMITCTNGFKKASKKLLKFEGRLDLLLVHKAYNNIEGEFKWGHSPGFAGDEIDGLVGKLIKDLKPKTVVSGHAHDGAGLLKDGVYYANPGVRGVSYINYIASDLLESTLNPSGDLSKQQVGGINNAIAKHLGKYYPNEPEKNKVKEPKIKLPKEGPKLKLPEVKEPKIKLPENGSEFKVPLVDLLKGLDVENMSEAEVMNEVIKRMMTDPAHYLPKQLVVPKINS